MCCYLLQGSCTTIQKFSIFISVFIGCSAENYPKTILNCFGLVLKQFNYFNSHQLFISYVTYEITCCPRIHELRQENFKPAWRCHQLQSGFVKTEQHTYFIFNSVQSSQKLFSTSCQSLQLKTINYQMKIIDGN